MVEEKKTYKILYEIEIEIYGVNEDGYNYWKDNEPTGREFKKAIHTTWPMLSAEKTAPSCN